jgi:site-specific DNA-methyltransferase (adenine-specific)
MADGPTAPEGSLIASAFGGPSSVDLLRQDRQPDILEFLADLSNDEILTPPKAANAVLDLLPNEVWSNPDLRWLDPGCKSGVFLREAAKRLYGGDRREGHEHTGLRDAFPDEKERREHIFKKMLHGMAVTQLMAMESRRTLYYSKDPTNKDYSVVRFGKSQPDGNVSARRLEHTYSGGSCALCGSAEGSLDRGEGRENYAYEFIHLSPEEVAEMKFDVVIGNPPYQLSNGESSAFPIYQLFVEQAFRLKPRYVSMIIPSRWFAGGKGLDAFRERMLVSTHFRNLVDFPNADDVFPGVSIEGGVCYFLWDVTYDGPCEVVTVQNGVPGSPAHRLLGAHGDIFIRFNEALAILEKVTSQGESNMEPLVSSQTPFGLYTNFADLHETEQTDDIALYTNKGKKWVQRSMVTRNREWIGQHKVLLSKAYGSSGNYPRQVIGHPVLAEPDSACTQTYLVIGPTVSEEHSENLASYLRTRFARFLIALRKNTQDIRPSVFSYVPVLDWSVRWTDEALYKRYKITPDEQAFIASIVREMPDPAINPKPAKKK